MLYGQPAKCFGAVGSILEIDRVAEGDGEESQSYGGQGESLP